VLDSLLHWLGYGLCHQLPERTISASGHLLPVCARDTGMYLGAILSMTVAAILDRGRRSAELPPRLIVGSALLGIAAMAADGVSSYAGWRETTNLLRLATGLTAGYGIGLLTLVLLNGEAWRVPGRERLLGRPLDAIVWLVSVPVSFAVAWWLLPLAGEGYALLVAACIILTYCSVNLLIVTVFLSPLRRAERWPDLWPAALAALLLTAVELAGAAAVKATLFRLVSGGS
jgi:uncharacterized membrane protein